LAEKQINMGKSCLGSDPCHILLKNENIVASIRELYSRHKALRFGGETGFAA
jgi:hypothetical protein